MNAEVRKYLENQGDSIDLCPIIGRYTASVREFYEWFWLKIEEKMRPEKDSAISSTRLGRRLTTTSEVMA